MKGRECGEPPRETQRIDRLLWMLRLAKSRSAAQDLVGGGHIRLNGRRIVRPAQVIGVGDVLTLPIGAGVRVIEILSLPPRRGPAEEAQSRYRDLASVSQQAGAA